MDKKITPFDTILKILNLYIGLLAIIGLLITLKIFSINNKPQFEILEPIYIFDMKEIIDAVKSVDNWQSVFPFSGAYGTLSLYGAPESMDKLKNFKYTLPYVEGDGNFHSGWSSFTFNNTIWYYLGIDDTTTIPKSSMDFASNRTSNQKRLGLTLLLISDLLKQADDKSLVLGGNLSVNPLTIIHNTKDSLLRGNMPKIFYATEIYSFLSIENKSSENMYNIRAYVNDVIGSGNLKVIGWTAATQGVKLISSSPNINISIEQLEPNESIEILFRGMKIIRKEDIKISIPPLSGINKKLVIAIIIIVFIFVIILFYIDYRIKRNQPSQKSRTD
jgi:hypothetical protein